MYLCVRRQSVEQTSDNYINEHTVSKSGITLDSELRIPFSWLLIKITQLITHVR
jgi:hypothetical protein